MSANRAVMLTPSVEKNAVTHGAIAVNLAETESRMSLVNPGAVYTAVNSPAATLQKSLHQKLSAMPAAELRKYPPALTIAGVVTFCSVFWYGAFQLFQALI